MTTLTDRERFLAMLYTQPLIPSDAIVVLCGEDCGPRLSMAWELYARQAAPGIVLTGGKHQPPRWTGANAARLDLLGKGVAPDRILIDADAQHTREQAINTLALAREKGWKRLTIVASDYHLPRAFLTFLAAVQDAGESEILRLSGACPPTRWTAKPDGMGSRRTDLLEIDAQKIVDYGDHVASYSDGLSYLLAWEGR